MMKNRFRLSAAGVLAFSILWIAACGPQESWKAENARIVKEMKLQVRARDDIPKSQVAPNLAPGVVKAIGTLPAAEIAPGVTAKMYWGKGVLVSWATLGPGAKIVEESLPAERLLVVTKGTVRQLVSGQWISMTAIPRDEPDGTHGRTPKNDLLYLDKGSRNALEAGAEGAEILEIYFPPRPDYMKKAGVTHLPGKLPEADFALGPTLEPGRIYDLNDFQFTQLVPGANSRLIGTRGFQASFLRMDPGSTFAAHLHPEEQLMIVMRGAIDELILNQTTPMVKGSLLLLPAGMVHGGSIGPLGCDVLDVFWPARPDYEENRKKRLAAFQSVIPAEARLELVVDGATQGPGLVFGEGPKWLGGKLYFSSMFFDQKWTGDPKRSSLVEMDPDGTYRRVIHGTMQTNGLMPLPNGNLAVCDMFGHRLLEMTTKGRVVRILASSYEGKPIDGPNDLVIDAKGGFYITDPQFTPEAKKSQPGRAVYYLTPGGKLIRVIGTNEFAQPNGILLSPDGKTLYVNNTYDDETWLNVNSDKDEWVWAYDVHDDGTVGNGRRFARLFLNPEVLERKGRSSGADGMTIDELGNIYVATWAGLQIFNAQGEFLGMVNTPVYPVSCCFGGDDMKTLFMVGYDKVFKIRTNVQGLRYGPK